MSCQDNTSISRDERQALVIERWKKVKCCGTMVAATGFGSEENNIYTYHRSNKDCAKLIGIYFSSIQKHKNCTRENPYIPKMYPNVKIYYSNEFIPNKEPFIEESIELLSGNIGESPNLDNSEINSEIKKSESLYSVESEPEKNITSPRVSDIPTAISG